MFIFMNLILINTLAWAMIENQTKISNYYRGSNTVKFIMRQDLDKGDMLKLYQLMDHTLLYCDVSKIDDGKIIGLVFKDAMFIPNLVEGRLFTEDDFAQEDPTVMIGKNILASPYHNDQFIQLFAREFQVIGVTAYKDNVALDNVIFLNLTSLNTLPPYRYFYLDGSSTTKIDYTIKKIQDIFDIYVIDEKSNPLDRIIVLSEQYGNISRMLIAIFILAVIFYCAFAWRSLKQETYIGILLGFSPGNLLKLIMEKYFVHNFTVILIILLEWLLLYLLGIKLPLLTLLVQLLLFLIIINIVLSIYVLGRFYKN